MRISLELTVLIISFLAEESSFLVALLDYAACSPLLGELQMLSVLLVGMNGWV